MVFFVGILSNLPPLAHVMRTVVASPNAGMLTEVLDAVYLARRAKARGETVILIGGSSVSRHLPTHDWLPGVRVLNASTMVGDIYVRTSHARFLIDYAPADVLLIPLIWNGFPDLADGPSRQTPLQLEWLPNPADQQVRQGIGFGYVDGLPLQLKRLLIEQAEALQSDDVHLWPPGVIPMGGYFAGIRTLPARVPLPSYRSVQRLETLRAYGAERGVTVLYYLSPHNPAYVPEYLPKEALGRFRRALRPHLYLDLADLVSREDFYPDLVHFNARGLALVSRTLSNTLASPGWTRAPGRIQVPGRWTRARLSVAYVAAAYRAGFYERLRPKDAGFLVRF